MRRHTISFKHAYDGIIYAIITQPNFRFHLFATLVVSLTGIYFNLDRFEWLVLIFTFLLVITTEMLNTALEAIVDLLSPEFHPAAKIAKDTAAGMVLLAALGSIVVGLVIFVPYLCRFF
jgi:diacylglycerol kinase